MSFFFNDPPTTEIYTLSLHDALPICSANARVSESSASRGTTRLTMPVASTSSAVIARPRSEEHTSELQSQFHLVCRLLLEKKKKYNTTQRSRDRRPTPSYSCRTYNAR